MKERVSRLSRYDILHRTMSGKTQQQKSVSVQNLNRAASALGLRKNKLDLSNSVELLMPIQGLD